MKVCFTGYCHNYQVDSMSSKLRLQLKNILLLVASRNIWRVLRALVPYNISRHGFIRSFYFVPYLFPFHMARRPNKDFLVFFLSVAKVILDTKFFRQYTGGGIFCFHVWSEVDIFSRWVSVISFCSLAN